MYPASKRGYTQCDMKTLPPPEVPGTTEAARFDNAVRKKFTVSKEEVQRRKAEWQKPESKRRTKKARC
jgi:hypothetical protein